MLRRAVIAIVLVASGLALSPGAAADDHVAATVVEASLTVPLPADTFAFIDEGTRDLLVIAALICLLVAGLLLNAHAGGRRPEDRRH